MNRRIEQNFAIKVGFEGKKEIIFLQNKSSSFLSLQPLKNKILIKTIIFNIDWCHRLTFFNIHEGKK